MNCYNYKSESTGIDVDEKYLTANHFCGLVVKTGQPIYGRSGIAKFEEHGITYYTRYFDVGRNVWEVDMYSDLR